MIACDCLHTKSLLDVFGENKLSNDDFKSFVVWAFGDMNAQLTRTPYLWNDMHGDLLKIDDTDCVYESTKEMVRLWKKS